MQYNRSLIIVGAGPRGLACAIQAINKFDNIYIIDDQPTSSWSSLSTVANFELRSPMSFDLVTYCTDHSREYSLSSIVLKEDVIHYNQQSIEEDSRRLNRVDFYNYLVIVKEMLKAHTNINFIYSKVLNIYNNNVELTNNDKIKFDYLILAQGVKEKLTPTNLKQYKQITNLDIINNDYQSLLVIGSGQGAYDIASYLYNKGVKVGLYINKLPKVHQYPAPSHVIWPSRSALSNYCANLPSTQSKMRYINNVKQWGPSITPNNEYLLTTIPIHLNEDIRDVISKYGNRFICRTGITPINMLGIEPTQITNNFRVKGTNIFVTGPLATLYDGPRVNSIISSSSTAMQIMEEIDASI